MIKKNKVNSFSKINAIALVVGIALIGIATYAVFNKSAGAQVGQDSNVSISDSTVYLVSDTSGLGASFANILASLGFGGEEIAVGGASGPYKTEHQIFASNFTVGPTTFATTSTVGLDAYILTVAEVNTNHTLVTWINNIDTTLTTQASTSAPFSNMRPGESFSTLWHAATTTAGATITFAAGDGVDLQEDEGGTVVINGLESARITYVKKADSDIIMIVEPYQIGD